MGQQSTKEYFCQGPGAVAKWSKAGHWWEQISKNKTSYVSPLAWAIFWNIRFKRNRQCLKETAAYFQQQGRVWVFFYDRHLGPFGHKNFVESDKIVKMRDNLWCQIEMWRRWAKARRPGPHFWLAVNKLQAQSTTSLILRKNPKWAWAPIFFVKRMTSELAWGNFCLARVWLGSMLKVRAWFGL